MLNAAFGAGTGPIYLDNLACVGTEPTLTNCTHDTHTADCTHSEDAGVRCNGIRKLYCCSVQFMYDTQNLLSHYSITLRLTVVPLYPFVMTKMIPYYLQASVMMETLGWWEEPISMMDVWRFAGMKFGALCVMISGQLLMQRWLADSWDSLPQARHWYLM